MDPTRSPLARYGLIVAGSWLLASLFLALLLRPTLVSLLLLSALALGLATVLVAPLLGLLLVGVQLLRWLSPAARAERAFRTGRLGEAVRLYLVAGRPEEAAHCLLVRLPAWAPKRELVAALAELRALQESARLARTAGVSPTITGALHADVADAQERLWRRAERYALVAEQGSDPASSRAACAGDAVQLRQLAAAAHQARADVALAMLRPGADEDLALLPLALQLTGAQAREWRTW